MSSQKTTNYDLNQWMPDDSVLRTDFNADNAKIDAALQALADTAAGKADAGELSALEDTVAAVSAAAGNCQMELFTYTGTGTMGSSNPTRITFSTLPDVFMVVGDLAILLGRGGETTVLLASKDVTYSESFISSASPSWSGTTMSVSNGVNARYQMNSSGKVYWVLGLKKKG